MRHTLSVAKKIEAVYRRQAGPFTGFSSKFFHTCHTSVSPFFLSFVAFFWMTIIYCCIPLCIELVCSCDLVITRIYSSQDGECSYFSINVTKETCWQALTVFFKYNFEFVTVDSRVCWMQLQGKNQSYNITKCQWGRFTSNLNFYFYEQVRSGFK